MALSKIDVANMLTGVTPVANGGTAATTFAAAGLGKRPNAKPLITNGDMAISQRSASVTGKTSTGIYTVDRMSAVINSIGTYTIAQESQTSGNAFDNGFANAWRIDCTTADASPAASDLLQMQTTFEGQDLQVFKKGTANAEKFTLAFWVKSNKTGTGNIQLKDKDNSNRQCTQSYTISSANTWEHKVCVFGADTTGAFDDDNAKSLIINWYLGSGTDSSSGTANHGTWEAQDQTKVNDGGTLNINDNTANDWAITGIQLEVGEFTSSTLPPFQFETFEENLARCQRYYYKIGPMVDGEYFGDGNIDGSNDAQILVPFAVTMRTNPTAIETSGTGSHYTIRLTQDNDCDAVPVFSNTGIESAMVIFKKSSHGLTNGAAALGRSNNDAAYLAWSADL
jgi:hypothetical protein